MFARRIASWTPGLLLMTAVRLPAQSPPPSPPRVFHACYVLATGTVYRIKEPGLLQRCVGRSIEFSWTDGDGALRSGDAAAGDLHGVYPNPTVAGLQGVPVAATPPTGGQVLLFDAASSSWRPGTSPAGVTDHGLLTGLADDDHTQYLLANGSRAVTIGFAVTGGYPTLAAPPASGTGTRLMWFAGKAALRAGTVDGALPTAWDDANVGVASTAFGYNSVASGAYSFACCAGATASNQFAAVLGSASTASGWASTAMGNNATASGDYSTAIGFQATTNGQAGSTVISDAAAGPVVSADQPNEFVVRASGGLRLRSNTAMTTGCDLPAGSGNWSCTSSRLLKTGFEDIDGEEVLDQVRRLPIQRWSYISEPGVRHLGPFAEDFRHAFALGTDDRSLGLLDLAGVNLAAAQALEQRTRTLQAQLRQRDRDVAQLRTQVNALRAERAGMLRRLERLEAAQAARERLQNR